MALMALALNSVTRFSRWHYVLTVIGVFGATMFYGDSVITPAISVLSAIEGLEVAAPGLEHWIVPLTIIVLVALYSVQRRGTAGIGKWFGPIMIVWFAALAVMGVINIVKAPVILQALNPWHAFQFMFDNPGCQLQLVAFVGAGQIVDFMPGNGHGAIKAPVLGGFNLVTAQLGQPFSLSGRVKSDGSHGLIVQWVRKLRR